MSPGLVFHVVAGTAGLLSGAAAMSFRKGSRLHRLAGRVFVLSMLGLGASGAYLGFAKHETMNGLMGVLTFYLVTSAWQTARHEGSVRVLDRAALVVPVAVGAALAILGVQAASSPGNAKEGYPAAVYFVFGALALLLAVGDVRVLVRGGVSGKKRIVRHLWRMGLALFIAVGSLFLGQQQVFPEQLRGTLALAAPVILTVALTLFWAVRVSLSRESEAEAPRTTATRRALGQQR